MGELNITEKPAPEDVDFLTQKINEEKPEQEAVSPFGIFIRDEAGRIIAGCNGWIIYGSIYTDQLWVHPDHRNRGIGERLMERVHEYGREKGCKVATVVTMSFHAPDFYPKLGYKVDFSGQGYAGGSSAIHFSKAL